MISPRKIFKPHIILTLIFLVQLCVYLLYVVGIFKSFRIAFVSTNIVGIFLLLLFYFIQIFITKYTGRRLSKYTLAVECINERMLFNIIYLYLIISLIGFLRLSLNLLSLFSPIQLLRMILGNRQIDYLNTGSGNTILVNFCIVSLILLATFFDSKKRKHIIVFLFNILLLILYASFLSSRILIIEGILFFLIILLRRKKYNNKLPLGKLLAFVVIVSIGLIITSGLRDFEQIGCNYTDSIFNWGISRLVDYFISVTNVSLEFPDFVSNASATFPINSISLFNFFINRSSEVDTYKLIDKVASAEYTNIGSFAQIYSDYKYLFFIFVIALAFFYSYAWKKFDKGNLIGYFIYPIIFYNILETWRIFFLGTEMSELLLIISIFTYLICRKYFRVNKVQNNLHDNPEMKRKNIKLFKQSITY